MRTFLTIILAAALGGCGVPNIRLLNSAVVILAKAGETEVAFRWKLGVCRPGYTGCIFVFGPWAGTRMTATMPAVPPGFVLSQTFVPQVMQRVSTPTATLLIERGTDLTWTPNQPPMPAASVAPAPTPPAYQDPLKTCTYCQKVLSTMPGVTAQTFGEGTLIVEEGRGFSARKNSAGEIIEILGVAETPWGQKSWVSLRLMPRGGRSAKAGDKVLIVSLKVRGKDNFELVVFPLPAE